jgi:putative radical SAM enzyme (TIGR03279 family)
MARNAGAEIAAVTPGSLGEELGLQPGDRLVALNGRPPRDLIDYLGGIAEETVTLLVRRAKGETIEFEVEKDVDDQLGLEFSSAVFDRIRPCANRCVFCFVDQLPQGLRASLYVKDDDYRLSFCQGNYITLTNLSDEDFSRIVRLRLSPLYVSVHATDPAVRVALLRQPSAAGVLDHLRRLTEAGIEVHAQLVLVPGWNDGAVLERTLSDLGSLWPGVQSVAAVPVSVSRHRHDSVPLRGFTRVESAAVLSTVHRFQARFQADLGTRLVFPADEFYLRAGKPIPASVAYEEYAQLEDGIGMVRKLWDEADAAVSAISPGPRPATDPVHLVTGLSGAQVLQPLLLGLQTRGLALNAHLLPVPNRFFDPEAVTVTGLLTGQDILAAVAATRQRGERVTRLLLPETVFRGAPGRTLDELSVDDLARVGDVDLRVLPVSGEALVRELTGEASIQ